MPGDHFEIVDEDEFEALAHAERLANEQTSVAHLVRPTSWDDDTGSSWSREGALQAREAYESEASYNSLPFAILSDDDLYDDDGEGVEFYEIDTGPEPGLADDDVTHVVRRPEASWWEAAKRGVRALTRTG
jgi:hypothetical protein